MPDMLTVVTVQHGDPIAGVIALEPSNSALHETERTEASRPTWRAAPLTDLGRTPGGSFRGFDVPSGLYTRDTVFAYRLVNGRVCERWAIRDDLAMMLQLGAIVARA